MQVQLPSCWEISTSIFGDRTWEIWKSDKGSFTKLPLMAALGLSNLGHVCVVFKCKEALESNKKENFLNFNVGND